MRTFTLADGLSWKDPAGRTRTETDLTEWLAARASTGRMAPRGFRGTTASPVTEDGRIARRGALGYGWGDLAATPRCANPMRRP